MAIWAFQRSYVRHGAMVTGYDPWPPRICYPCVLRVRNVNSTIPQNGVVDMPSRAAMSRTMYLKVTRVTGIMSQIDRVTYRGLPTELMLSEWVKLTALAAELAEMLEEGISHTSTATAVVLWKKHVLDWLGGRHGSKRGWMEKPHMEAWHSQSFADAFRGYLNGMTDRDHGPKVLRTDVPRKLWEGSVGDIRRQLSMPKVLRVLDPQTFDFETELPGEKLHSFFMDVFARWQEKTGDESGIETWTLGEWWRHIADEWEVTMTEIGPGLRAKGTPDDNIAQVDQG